MKRTALFPSLFLLVVSAPIFFASCGGPANERRLTEMDQAIEDLRLFVTEKDAVSAGNTAYPAVNFEEEMAEMAVEYEQLQTRLKPHLDQADEVRRQEVAGLQARYDTLRSRRTRAYRAYVKSRSMRQELLGVSQDKVDLGDITAADIADRYHTFAERVAANHSQYTPTEWNVVEGLWTALESRRQEVEAKLSQPDQARIEQARNRYLAVRSSLNEAASAETKAQ